MSKFFYTRLAKENLKKNKSSYFPYILTGICTVAVFYMILSLTTNPGIRHMNGGRNMQMVLQFGTAIVGIFAVIFLFYTNSFLIKRRKKELGLYCILGMDKGNLARLISLETLLVSLASVAGGLVVGVVLDRLLFWILLRVVHYEIPIRYHFHWQALVLSAVIFGAIYLLTLLFNLLQIGKARPVELLRGGNMGEKEPKTRIIMAAAGALCMGAGYYIAITTENVIAAFSLFFVAVLLVILGTYLIFTAGSIAVLKALRWNKGYYYHPRHFVSVSGMIYRMKQNAVGLANICILSTGVLLAVATSVSMYASVQEIIATRYPTDASFTLENDTLNFDDNLEEVVEETAREVGTEVVSYEGFSKLEFTVVKEGSVFLADENYTGMDFSQVILVTEEEYERLTGEKPNLGEDQVWMYTLRGDTDDTQIELFGRTYQVKKHLEKFSESLEASDLAMLIDSYYLVVTDETMEEIYNGQKEAYQEYSSDYRYYGSITLSDEEEETQKNFAGKLREKLSERYTDMGNDNGMFMYLECRAEHLEDIYMLYGGFLFMGIFLGLLFLMATVLIIYYKQISEGYDDQARFAIMRKVGMSDREIRKTIDEQVRKVFFLPLGMAAVHVCAAFPLMNRMLKLLNMYDTKLFLGCTVGTLILFAVFYTLVFKATARTYYKIVKG